jgi:hypothetical protein
MYKCPFHIPRGCCWVSLTQAMDTPHAYIDSSVLNNQGYRCTMKSRMQIRHSVCIQMQVACRILSVSSFLLWTSIKPKYIMIFVTTMHIYFGRIFGWSSNLYFHFIFKYTSK